MVEIATPDHWHALPMIAAVKAGVDMYVQKPISVDVVEGQAMLAAARKYKRVVQVGTQRRSTPHLIEARDTRQEGKLGTIGHVEIYSLWQAAGQRCRRTPRRPGHSRLRIVDRARAHDGLTAPSIQRNWRAFMEYGNGTIGDMGIHMFDMVRWFMDLGWPKRISSFGGLRVLKGGSRTSPTRRPPCSSSTTSTWSGSTAASGSAPDPNYPWGATLYGDKGTLKAGVMGYDFIPVGRGAQPIHKDVTYELEQYPEDKTEPRLEKHVAPGHSRPHEGPAEAMATRGRAGRGYREGYISSSCCILANLSMQLGRTLAWDTQKGGGRRRRGQRLLRRPYRKPWVHPEVA